MSDGERENQGHGGGPPPGREYNIQIDRVHYKVTQENMTGLQLRQVPTPQVGPDRDLFEVVPGGTDQKIGDATVVTLRDGKRFFTAPAQINPGGIGHVAEE